MLIATYFPMAQHLPVGQNLLIIHASRSHSLRRTTVSGREISPSHRPLPDNTQQTDIRNSARHSNPQSEQASGVNPNRHVKSIVYSFSYFDCSGTYHLYAISPCQSPFGHGVGWLVRDCRLRPGPRDGRLSVVGRYSYLCTQYSM